MGKVYSLAVFTWMMAMGTAFALGKARPEAPSDYLDHFLGNYDVKKGSKKSPRSHGRFFREDVVHAESGRTYSLYQLVLHGPDPETPETGPDPAQMIDLLIVRDDAGNFHHTLYANGFLHKALDGKFYRLPKEFAKIPAEELKRALIPFRLKRGRIFVREPELSSVLVKFTAHNRMEVRIREYSAALHIIPSVDTDRYVLERTDEFDPEVDWADAPVDTDTGDYVELEDPAEASAPGSRD